MSHEEVLRRITALVVRCLDPEEVVLFGSVAKGRAGVHSDVDLLVIGDFAGPPHRRGHELRGLLDAFAVRIDLHLHTRTEVEAETRHPHNWMSSVRSTGITLYKRTHKMEKTPARS